MTREPWTPYGLESIRARRIRQRRVWALLGLLSYILLYGAFVLLTTTTNLSVGAGGGGGTVELDLSFPEERSPKPLTVVVGPGRMTLADFAAQGNPQPPVRSPPPFLGEPIQWKGELMTYGPLLLLLWIFLSTFRSTDRHGELNYGIYKGAMPYEMITAHARQHIFTTRRVKAPLFGRTPEDYGLSGSKDSARREA